MVELIKSMIEFYETGNLEIFPNFAKQYNIKTEYDIDTFKMAVLDILAWLCTGYEDELWKNRVKYGIDEKSFPIGYSFARNKRQKTLELDPEEESCILMKEIVDHDSQFSLYFVINHNKLSFKKTIGKKERIEGMKFVYNNYYIHTCPVLD